MAIVYDTVSTKTGGAATSFSWTHTAASDANLLVVCVTTNDTNLADRSVTSIT